MPHAGAHLLPEAAARYERRLEAVRCSTRLCENPVFGACRLYKLLILLDRIFKNRLLTQSRTWLGAGEGRDTGLTRLFYGPGAFRCLGPQPSVTSASGAIGAPAPAPQASPAL